MGLSVWNQVNTDKFFSISKINKKTLEKHGINIPVTQFKDIVKKTPPHNQIPTGSTNSHGHLRMTNIYRFEDFNYLKSINTAPEVTT